MLFNYCSVETTCSVSRNMLWWVGRGRGRGRAAGSLGNSGPGDICMGSPSFLLPSSAKGERTRLWGPSSPHGTGGNHVLKAAWAAPHDNHAGWLLCPGVPCNALSGLLPLLGTGFFSRGLEGACLWKPNQAISRLPSPAIKFFHLCELASWDEM